MNDAVNAKIEFLVSAGCHINDVMNSEDKIISHFLVSAGCHINDVMNRKRG